MASSNRPRQLTRTVVVRFPQDVYDALEDAAATGDVTVSARVRDAVRADLGLPATATLEVTGPTGGAA